MNIDKLLQCFHKEIHEIVTTPDKRELEYRLTPGSSPPVPDDPCLKCDGHDYKCPSYYLEGYN